MTADELIAKAFWSAVVILWACFLTWKYRRDIASRD